MRALPPDTSIMRKAVYYVRVKDTISQEIFRVPVVAESMQEAEELVLLWPFDKNYALA